MVSAIMLQACRGGRLSTGCGRGSFHLRQDAAGLQAVKWLSSQDMGVCSLTPAAGAAWSCARWFRPAL